MIISKTLPVTAALLLFCSFLNAQITFNSDDAAFFNEKAEKYQRWLDKTGLGRALRFDKLRLKDDSTELEMFLLMKSTDLDTAISMWSQVKKDFQSSPDRASLEEKLFLTFVDFMEIPPEQGNVQIYVKDAAGEYIKCFFVAAGVKKGKVVSREQIGECRADINFNIPISPAPVKKVTGKRTTFVQKQLGTDEVFSAIERFIRQQYGVTRCYDRTPELNVTKNGAAMTLTVENLCRVVLTNENQSLWCDVMNSMGISCNDMRRERLEFKFTYQEGSNALTGTLSGKFGSGVYKPRASGYFDMEPDFSDYINSFHRDFQSQLKEYLNKL